MKLLAMVVAKRPGAQGDCCGASLIFQMPPSPQELLPEVFFQDGRILAGNQRGLEI